MAYQEVAKELTPCLQVLNVFLWYSYHIFVSVYLEYSLGLTFQPHKLLITCFENQIHIEVSSRACLMVREISPLKVLKVHEQCGQNLAQMD